MRSITTSYPHGSPWITLSILTNSATMSRPPVFWFTRSTNAGGKLCSWPNRIPIFFIQREPPITRLRSPWRPTAWQARTYTDSSKAEFLKPFRVPIRILQAALAFVFEEFVNRRQQDTGAFRIDPHVKVEFVVHEIDIAATDHGKKFSSDFEVFAVNDPFLDGEVGGRIPGDAVAGARNNQI